jgi:hypothetical protein
VHLRTHTEHFDEVRARALGIRAAGHAPRRIGRRACGNARFGRHSGDFDAVCAPSPPRRPFFTHP